MILEASKKEEGMQAFISACFFVKKDKKSKLHLFRYVSSIALTYVRRMIDGRSWLDDYIRPVKNHKHKRSLSPVDNIITVCKNSVVISTISAITVTLRTLKTIV